MTQTPAAADHALPGLAERRDGIARAGAAFAAGKVREPPMDSVHSADAHTARAGLVVAALAIVGVVAALAVMRQPVKALVVLGGIVVFAFVRIELARHRDARRRATPVVAVPAVVVSKRQEAADSMTTRCYVTLERLDSPRAEYEVTPGRFRRVDVGDFGVAWIRADTVQGFVPTTRDPHAA